METTDAIRLLQTLGLSNYEGRALEALIASQAMTAEEVAGEAEIPMGRIYDVLGSLEERSLVRHDGDRPKTYVPVTVEQAVDRLLEQRIATIENEQEQAETAAQRLEPMLEDQVQGRSEEAFATTAFRHQNAVELLVERIETAESEVVIAAGSIREGPETQKEIASRLAELLESGVDIRLLMDGETTVTDQGLREAGLEVRASDIAPDQRFIVVDDREVCLEVVHPINPDELLAVVNFRTKEVADDLGTAFEEIWQKATPLSMNDRPFK